MNRPLDNVITMEPYPELVKQYADNSIIVRKWHGDKKDRFLTEDELLIATHNLFTLIPREIEESTYQLIFEFYFSPD